jgi:hypothetical protein
MKHIETKQLNAELIALINYCVENKVTNFTLNYALNKNLKRITTSIEEVDKCISQELKDLETKIWEEAKKINAESPEFINGLDVLTDEESAKRIELMDEYNKAMQEESDVELYLIDPLKIEEIKIEFAYLTILGKFLKE